jgi:hypothetical protein
MKVYFTEEFKRLSGDSSSRLSLQKFKLGAYSTPVSKWSDLDWTYMTSKDSGRSPTDGYYTFTSILRDGTLDMCLEIPGYDVGMLSQDYYKLIYVIYSDDIRGSSGLAFVLLGDTWKDKDGIYQIAPLRLNRSRNIISVPGIEGKCHIDTSMSEDTEFLEGVGLGDPGNLGVVTEGYVSRDSYDIYRTEKLSTDEYPHLETVYINKFGIKIY